MSLIKIQNSIHINKSKIEVEIVKCKDSYLHIINNMSYLTKAISISVVCYRMIATPYVRSISHVFAYLYTLDDDLE